MNTCLTSSCCVSFRLFFFEYLRFWKHCISIWILTKGRANRFDSISFSFYSSFLYYFALLWSLDSCAQHQFMYAFLSHSFISFFICCSCCCCRCVFVLQFSRSQCNVLRWSHMRYTYIQVHRWLLTFRSRWITIFLINAFNVRLESLMAETHQTFISLLFLIKCIESIRFASLFLELTKFMKAYDRLFGNIYLIYLAFPYKNTKIFFFVSAPSCLFMIAKIKQTQK